MVEDRSKEVSRIYKKIAKNPEIFFKTQMEYSKYRCPNSPLICYECGYTEKSKIPMKNPVKEMLERL